jgi:hypothetical protein
LRQWKRKPTMQIPIVIIVVLAMQIAFVGCVEEKNADIPSSERDSKTAINEAKVDNPDTKMKTPGDTEWKYEKTIEGPLKIVAGESPATLGSLDANRIIVEIPEKTFKSDTIVTLENPDPDDIPKFAGRRFEPLDSPIEIKAVKKDGGKLLRLEEPVVITMKIDKNRLERSFDRASVQIAYFNGTAWDFTKPIKFDLDAGIITFKTYSLGIFGYGKVSVAEQIEQYVHRKSLTGKALVETINYEIALWKYAEIEAAYTAYRDGADGGFWGYRNNARDFDAVWDQIHGFCYQLENEAIRTENEHRDETGLPLLSEQEAHRIRNEVRDGIKKQFENRVDNEGGIAKKEAELKYLVDSYKSANLMETGTFGYDTANDTLDTRLDDLLYLRDKILRDTGRKQITGSAITDEKALSVGDLVILSQIWYSKNGRVQYERYLEDELGVDISRRR